MAPSLAEAKAHTDPAQRAAAAAAVAKWHARHAARLSRERDAWFYRAVVEHRPHPADPAPGCANHPDRPTVSLGLCSECYGRVNRAKHRAQEQTSAESTPERAAYYQYEAIAELLRDWIADGLWTPTEPPRKLTDLQTQFDATWSVASYALRLLEGWELVDVTRPAGGRRVTLIGPRPDAPVRARELRARPLTRPAPPPRRTLPLPPVPERSQVRPSGYGWKARAVSLAGLGSRMWQSRLEIQDAAREQIGLGVRDKDRELELITRQLDLPATEPLPTEDDYWARTQSYKLRIADHEAAEREAMKVAYDAVMAQFKAEGGPSNEDLAKQIGMKPPTIYRLRRIWRGLPPRERIGKAS